MCVTNLLKTGEDMVTKRQLQGAYQSNAQAHRHGYRPACRKVSRFVNVYVL